MIRNIIFDIGQVLVDFNWEPYINSLGFTREKTERLKKATVLGKHWGEQDRGTYSREELIQLFLELDDGIEKELNLFLDSIEGIVEEREYAFPLIKQLKRNGYQVYLLSNYGKFAYETASKKFQFTKAVDGAVISYETGFIKPDSRIYQVLLKRYGLDAGECLFLDDNLDNIKAAKSLGFHGIWFQNPAIALDEMKKYQVRTEGLRL